ncbi:MAG: hypothetical protein AAGK78_03120 [Planctomycetota bacterium]
MPVKMPWSLAALLLSGSVLTGCASNRQAEVVRDADGYEPQVALALATTPPVVRDRLDVDSFDAALVRAGRGEAAFVGFDSTVVETLDVVVRDYQNFGIGGGGFGHGFGHGFGGFGFSGFGNFDRFSRRAVSTRSFTRTR